MDDMDLATSKPMGDQADTGAPISVTAIREPSIMKPVIRMTNMRLCIYASSFLVSRPSGRKT